MMDELRGGGSASALIIFLLCMHQSSEIVEEFSQS